MKKQKLSELAKSKGFFAVLLSAVFIIVTITLISLNLNQGEENLVDLNDEKNVAESQDENQVASSDDDTYVSEGNDATQGNVLEAEESNKTQTESAQVAEGGQTSNEQQTTKEAATVNNGEKIAQEENAVPVMNNVTLESLSFKTEDGLQWPLRGNIILGYSADHAIYHKTLMQFKTNPAILIQGEVGTEVVAAARGIITAIDSNVRTGHTITLAIGGDYSLVYGQLEPVEYKVGDVIEKGQVIGKLAKVTKYYSVEGEHLYFQVLNGESTVNPMLLIRDTE